MTKIKEEDLPKTTGELLREKSLSHCQLTGYTLHILGKILTTIDAVIVDPRQNKATKDLISSQVWESSDTVKKWVFDQYDGNGTTFPYRPLNQG